MAFPKMKKANMKKKGKKLGSKAMSKKKKTPTGFQAGAGMGMGGM